MTSKDKKGAEQWMDVHSEGRDDAGELKKLWNATGAYKNSYMPDVEQGLSKFNSRIKGEADSKVVALRRPNYLLRIAAAVAVLLISIFAYNQLNRADGNMETVASEAGASSSIQLHDGSSVTLNEKSSLAFPEVFQGKERRVRLEGEGFFEVEKDADKPFLVETALAEVQVLGTSFNIRSYANEDFIEVYVSSGKVSVMIKSTGEKVMLVLGERLFFEKNKNAPEKSLDKNGNATAWKTGTVRFRDSSFEEIFSTVEKSFGVKIEVKDRAVLKCMHTISIPLNISKLREAFKALEKAYPIQISEPAPKQFIVTGNCR